MAERAETQYLNLLRDIRDNGEVRNDRTGTGTHSHFGEQMKYNMREGAPILTSKRVTLGAAAHELIKIRTDDECNIIPLAPTTHNDCSIIFSSTPLLPLSLFRKI